MKAYVQVYTGEGKGKTTAAIGLAIRGLLVSLARMFVNVYFLVEMRW